MNFLELSSSSLSVCLYVYLNVCPFCVSVCICQCVYMSMCVSVCDCMFVNICKSICECVIICVIVFEYE